jgi:hypothetical protein
VPDGKRQGILRAWGGAAGLLPIAGVDRARDALDSPAALRMGKGETRSPGSSGSSRPGEREAIVDIDDVSRAVPMPFRERPGRWRLSIPGALFDDGARWPLAWTDALRPTAKESAADPRLATGSMALSRSASVNKTIQFGESVDGYPVPVLNEREIRAAAGMLFLATFLSLLFILFRSNFIPIKFVIPAFLIDFLIRVFVNPRFSPTLIAGRLIVGGQNPEYVAAKPKRLAWVIGIALSATMFILMVVMNTFGPITGITCLVCLVFLFFESAFGICLGCKFYRLVYREAPTLCPGEVCEVKARQEIQRTSAGQWLVLVAFAALIVVASVALTRTFSAKPHPLFGGATAATSTSEHRAAARR